MDTKILRDMSYGVYVVSTMDGMRPTGCIANSAMQITSSPATIAVSINHNNYTNECIKKCKHFAVSILSEKSDAGIIGTFGFSSGKDTNKFEKTAYDFASGLPYVSDSCGYMTCMVKDIVETSTHTIFIGEIEDAAKLSDNPPMTYAYYHNVIKGKSPKNAPTYDASQEAVSPSADNTTLNKFVCSVCGYVYETEDEVLPDDFVCPICKMPKDKFVKE